MTLQPLATKTRISSIDIVRGIVMVIMALDHTRDFFHYDSLQMDPTDLTKTYPALFFTRIITHFCAPTFVMLAGTSIYISAQRKSKRELSFFLLTRGLWLIVIELVVIRFGFMFNFYYDLVIFQVIWAIGASMIVMAALIHLNETVLIILAAVFLLGHNLLDPIQLTQKDSGFWPWMFFYQSGFASLGNGNAILVPYPVLPWLSIMLSGYVLGMLYKPTVAPADRQRYLLIAGAAATLLFIVLRYINLYGDPAPWSVQKNSMFTFMSFVNTTKYPASLLYTLMTLGPILILLAIVEKIQTNILQPFVIYGRVPMFYYILHFYFIHIFALTAYLITTGKSWSDLDFHFGKSFGGILTDDGGYSLGITYLAWAGIVLLLYPLCRAYNRYKSTHTHWWLSYL